MSLKVAVLAGGDSAESAISRSSAEEVLLRLGERHLVELIELDENITKNITALATLKRLRATRINSSLDT